MGDNDSGVLAAAAAAGDISSQRINFPVKICIGDSNSSSVSSSSTSAASAAAAFCMHATSAIIFSINASSSSLDENVTVLSFLGRPRLFFSAVSALGFAMDAVTNSVALRGRPRPRPRTAGSATRSEITGASAAPSGPIMG